MRRCLAYVLLLLWSVSPWGGALSVKADKEKLKVVMAKDAYSKKQYFESSKLWKQLIDSDPKNALYYFNYAQTQFQRKKYIEALKGHRYVIKLRSPLAPASKLYIATIYYEMGREIEAINILRGLVHSNVAKGVRAEAQRELERIDPEEREKRKRKNQKKLNAPIEFPIGLKFFKQGKYKLAILNLELASQSYEEPELYLIRGISYYKLGFEKRAEKDFKKVIVKSDDPDMRKNAEMILTMIKKKKDAKRTVAEQSRWILTLDNAINFNSSPLTLSDVGKKSEDSQYNLFVEFGRKIIDRKNLVFTATYEGDFNESFKTTKDRFVEHSLNFSLRGNHKKYSYKVEPSYSYEESGKNHTIIRSVLYYLELRI